MFPNKQETQIVAPSGGLRFNIFASVGTLDIFSRTHF